jgi:hypothetical protein
VNAREIAVALGNATREGRNWRCRCPLHDGAGLYLRDGQDKLLVYCWAECKREAILAELRRRGLLDDDPVAPKRRSEPRLEPAKTSHVDLALKIWGEGANPRGTLVEPYFRTRGSALWDRAEEAIRYHPACPFKGERVPSIVALLRDIRTDEPCGIHRTALLADGSDRDRARGKAMLGRAAGAAIKLCPSDSVTLGLGIAEGIETGAAVISIGWHPVWGAASAGAIAQFPVLSGIEELTIFADCDANGVGQRAAQQCLQRWREVGQLAAIRPTPDGNT